MDRVETFLQHFVEQPYDPVKAHEYYIKNRDLKGRSTNGMSELQKEAWAYSKNRVDTDKKQQVEATKVLNDQKIQAFQQSATDTRNRISEKLKLFAQRLSNETSSNRQSIANKLKSDIANIAPIPKNVTPEQRVALVLKRNKELDAIRNSSSKDSANLSSDSKDSTQKGTNSASIERNKVTSDLKTVISKTRDEYIKAKTQLDTSYESIYNKEYTKVMTTVAGKSKKAPNKPAKKPTNKSSKAPIEGGFYYKSEGKVK